MRVREFVVGFRGLVSSLTKFRQILISESCLFRMHSGRGAAMRLEIAAEKFKIFAATPVKPDKLALARTARRCITSCVINAPIPVGAMPESFSQRKILIPHQEIQPPVQLPARLCENCCCQFQSAPLVSHLPGLQSRRICAIQRQKSERALAGRDSSNPGTTHSC